MVTTGRPDHVSACSLSQCCRCCRLGVVFRMLIWETVIWDILTNASTATSRATAAMVTVALQVTGGHGHTEVDSPAAANDAIDVGGFEEVSDHYLGSGGSQGRRPLVLAAHHGANRKPTLEEQPGHCSPNPAELTGCSGYED